MLRGSPFSAGTVTISPRNSKTARAPVGETAASRSQLAAPGVALAELGEVGGDADREAPVVVFPDVIEMEDARLLEDDPAARRPRR